MDPNAVQDILLNPRYEGMMSTISGVTDVVDGAFMTVITFVAFFIISVALLRNVLAGAYCAFPKFWDQVAHAHEENENTAFFEQIKGIKDSYKTASMGSIKTFLFRIVPNIKCLTDFEDDTLSAKSYFIKAIPQMIGVVIIGVFIYNGYYRDFTAVIANTGSELIERTVLSFDPVGAFDTIMNTAGKPAFATDDSLDMFGKNKNKVANDIYSCIISKYTDIKDANAKAELAKDIDAAVEAMFPANSDAEKWFGAENGEYDVQIRVNLVKYFDASTRAHGAYGTDDVFSKAWCIGLGKEGNTSSSSSCDGASLSPIVIDSTVEAINQEWCIGVAVQATRHAVKTDVGGAAEATATAKASDATTLAVAAKGTNTEFDAVGKDSSNTEIKAHIAISFAQDGGNWKMTLTPSAVSPATTVTAGTYDVNFKIPAIKTTGGVVEVTVKKLILDSSSSLSVSATDSSGYSLSMANGVLTATKKESQPAQTTVTSSSSANDPVVEPT